MISMADERRWKGRREIENVFFNWNEKYTTSPFRKFKKRLKKILLFNFLEIFHNLPKTKKKKNVRIWICQKTDDMKFISPARL